MDFENQLLPLQIIFSKDDDAYIFLLKKYTARDSN